MTQIGSRYSVQANSTELKNIRTNRTDATVNLSNPQVKPEDLAKDLEGAIASGSDQVLVAVGIEGQEVKYAEMTPDEAGQVLAQLRTKMGSGEAFKISDLQMPESVLANNNDPTLTQTAAALDGLDEKSAGYALNWKETQPDGSTKTRTMSGKVSLRDAMGGLEVPCPNTIQLCEQHTKVAGELQKYITHTLDPQIAKVQGELAQTEDPARKTELQGQLDMLTQTREVMSTVQQIRAQMGKVPNSTWEGNNKATPPEVMAELTRLNAQLGEQNAALDALLGPDSPYAGTRLVQDLQKTVGEVKGLQQSLGDVLTFCNDSEMLGLRAASGKGVNVNAVSRDYHANMQLIEDNRRRGEGEQTPGLEGFKAITRNDHKYGIAYAQKFSALSGEIAAIDFAKLKPEEIKAQRDALITKIDSGFKDQSGRYVISQDKVRDVIKVYTDQFDVAHAEARQQANSAVITQQENAVIPVNQTELDAVQAENDAIRDQIVDVGVDKTPEGFGKQADNHLSTQNRGNIQGADQLEERLDNDDQRIEQQEIRLENYKELTKPVNVVEITSTTENFVDMLSPVNSPGDRIGLSLSGKAGVRLFGPVGVEVNGGVGIEVSMGDDGRYYVGIDRYVDGRVAVSGGAGSLSAGVGGAQKDIWVFDNTDQVNQFLLKKFEETGVNEFFDNMDRSNLRTSPTHITQGSTYFVAEGQIKIGKVEVSGKYQGTSTTTTFPNGVVSNDWSHVSQVNVSLPMLRGVELKGTYQHYAIEKDPYVPENVGEYRKFEGQVTLELLPQEIAQIKKSLSSGGETKALDVYVKLEQIAASLGMVGPQATRFVHSSFDKMVASLNGENVTGKNSIKIGLAVQAQWEVDGDQERNQYWRLGSVASLSKSYGADVGVAYAEVNFNAEAVNFMDISTGATDETYLKGLFHNNPKAYLELKQRMGSDNIVQGDIVVDVAGKKTERVQMPLAQWEAYWLQESEAARTISGTTRINDGAVRTIDVYGGQ